MIVRAIAKVEYAAHSYIWGNAKRLVPGKESEIWLSTPGALSQKQGDVPKTSRDALKAAADPRIVNLWVDAFCINQSNPEEVKHHMDAMDAVYKSAVLTIVATTKYANLGLPSIIRPCGPP
jgi:hypothetical protein